MVQSSVPSLRDARVDTPPGRSAMHVGITVGSKKFALRNRGIDRRGTVALADSRQVRLAAKCIKASIKPATAINILEFHGVRVYR